MYVCICNAFTDSTIKKVLDENQGKTMPMGEVYKKCSDGEKPQCCKCLETVKEIVSSHYKGTKDPQMA